MDYLEGNTTLALDILVRLDLVRFNIPSKLKVNMTTLDNTACYNNNNDDGDDSSNSLALALL